jgi:hypothetical protein
MGPVGSLGVEMLGERKAQKQRRAILNRSMEATQRTQNAAIGDTLGEAQNMSPEARMRAMDEAQGTIGTQLQQDMAGSGGLTSPVAGRRSDAYSQALMTREAGEKDRASALMGELAKVRAPGNMLLNENLRQSNLAEALSSMWGSARNRHNAALNDVEAVMPPWWGQLAAFNNRFMMAKKQQAGQAAKAYTGGGMG